MKHNYVRFTGLLIGVLLVFAFVSAETAFPRGGKVSGYSLTIYVDEGFGELNGHVFIGLTAGQTSVYAGWYSDNKIVDALWGEGGGNIADDRSLAACGWDVKQTFNITQAGYRRAIQGMADWENSGKKWAVTNHCGDFAETIAQMAGVPVRLPLTAAGRNRPELFGKYLRNNSGERISNTYDVNSYVNTRTSIKKGDKVSIRAIGLVSFGVLAGIGMPEGVEFGTNLQFFRQYTARLACRKNTYCR